MKNPWMSLWLSAANQAAGAARGAWVAEVRRQQQAFAREAVKAWSFGAETRRPKAPKRRGK